MTTSAIPPVQSAWNTCEREASRRSREVHSTLKLPRMVTKEMRTLGSLVKKTLARLPAGLSHVLSATKTIKLCSIPNYAFNIRDNIRIVVDRKESSGNRFKAFLKIITNSNDIADASSGAFEILHTARVIGGKALSWIPAFKIADYFIQFINTGFTIETAHKARILYQSLRETQKELDREVVENEHELGGSSEETETTFGIKANALRSAITIEPDENGKETVKVFSHTVPELQKDLLIGKEIRLHPTENKTNLEERVHKVATNLLSASIEEQGQAIKDGERIIEKLSKRTKKEHLPRSIVDLASRIAGTVAATLIIISPLVPVAAPVLVPIGLATFLCTEAVSIGLWGAKTFFTKRDPFDENAKNRAQEILSSIEEKGKAIAATCKAKVQGIHLPKLNCFRPAVNAA